MSEKRRPLRPEEIEDAKSRDLVALIGSAVKFRRQGQALWGCCPFHKDKTPSFKVENGRYKCFGCGKGGDAIEWIKEAEHLDFYGAVKRLSSSTAPVRFAGIVANSRPREYEETSKLRKAQKLWDGAKDAKGTPVEAYLRSRKVKGPISSELRFDPACVYSDTKETYPTMIARLADDSGLCAVQRTYLARDGVGKANVPHPKKTQGRMKGAAVRLRMPSSDVLGLAEGIETAMSAAHLYQLPVWATLSAMRLSQIDIPKTVRNITIFADAGKVGQDEAYKTQEIYENRGLFVEVVLPGADFGPGYDDFNSAIQGQQ